MIDFTAVDYLPIALYLILLFWLGFRSGRQTNRPGQFILGSRSLCLPAFIATLVTTWYGGILGVGEFTFRFGLSAWVVFGLPYYLFALLYALFLAPKIRRSDNRSIPELLYARYGKPAGILGGFFLIIMTSPAPYILMLAAVLQMVIPIGFHLSVLIGTFVSIVYVFAGGFRSVVQTDKLQFILMFGGFVLLLYFSVQRLSIGALIGQLNEGHTSLSGGLSPQQILAWFIIASWTFIDPGFHQRSAAARTPQTARRGILLSIAFWYVFDMLTLLCGLYAFVLFPEIEPVRSYPHLANMLLPPVLKGLFFTGLLAVIMSTIDSYTFLSAISIGNDLIAKLKGVSNGNGQTRRWIRWGLLATALLSIALIFYIPSIIELWYHLGSLFIPPLLIPVLAGLAEKKWWNGKIVFWNMVVGFTTSAGWLALSTVDWPGQHQLHLVEPIFPGLLISTIILLSTILFNKSKNN